MTYLRVTNFWEYQNADAWNKAGEKKRGPRRPTWCKLFVYRDDELDRQPAHVRLVFLELLRLATLYANAIPNDSQRIANEIRVDPKLVSKALTDLEKGGWIKGSKTARFSRKPSRKTRALDVEVEIETPQTPLRGGTAKAMIDATESFRKWLNSPAWDQDFTRDLVRDEVNRINKSHKTTGSLDEFTALRMWQEARQARKYEEAV